MNPLLRCFLITMYNEFDIVQKTITLIKSLMCDAVIYVIQSDDSSGRILTGMNKFMTLENLGDKIKRHKLPSHAITRNYGSLFKMAYESGFTFDFIAGITGDTLLTDPTTCDRIYDTMVRNNKILACSQAIGQNFHAEDSDPENGRCGGRIQFDGISDFMPQFFIVKGDFAHRTKVFSDIKITNEFTSEQCLGDELLRHVRGSFKENALVIANNAYSYSDGIVYQAR